MLSLKRHCCGNHIIFLHSLHWHTTMRMGILTMAMIQLRNISPSEDCPPARHGSTLDNLTTLDCSPSGPASAPRWAGGLAIRCGARSTASVSWSTCCVTNSCENKMMIWWCTSYRNLVSFSPVTPESRRLNCEIFETNWPKCWIDPVVRSTFDRQHYLQPAVYTKTEAVSDIITLYCLARQAACYAFPLVFSYVVIYGYANHITF